jgi:hypothetical protein
MVLPERRQLMEYTAVNRVRQSKDYFVLPS